MATAENEECDLRDQAESSGPGGDPGPLFVLRFGGGAGWGGEGSEDGAVVGAFEFADPFFEGFEFDGDAVEDGVAVVLGFLVGEVGDGRVDFHHEAGDVAAGVADLLNGVGAFHGGGS